VLKKTVLSRIALTGSLVIIGVAAWFWYEQLMSAIELLEMAG